jgi:hypothetical protein
LLPQEICDVVPENCPESGICELPHLENCAPLDTELGCADLEEVLAGADPGAAGAAGAAN